jgi:hypothetical protein
MTGEHTFHPDTRALIGFGRALAGRTHPGRQTSAAQVMDRLMVLERHRDGRWPMRTFGAELVSLFGRDLRDQDFATLWLSPDWALVASLAAAAEAAREPGVARVKGETACGRVLGLELVLTPLRAEPLFGERFLAMLQPLGGEAFLEGRPLVRLRLTSLHPPLAKAPATVRLVVSNG